MLKRRRRIQKYIKALKNKARGISAQDVEKLKIQEEEDVEYTTKRVEKKREIRNGVSISTRMDFQGKQEEEGMRDQSQEGAVWQDQDDELDISKRNMFKKLQLEDNATEKQYEDRLKKFYKSKYGVKNWAVQGQGQQEQDLNDLLNHEELYSHAKKKRQGLRVDFIARTTEHHNSVVTGLDWKGQVVASCGYDQKVKLWSLREEEQNPELKLRQEKDIYVEGFALSNCHFSGQSLILGTLRQNYVVLDCNKLKINKVASSFLNVHPTFQNIRLSQDHKGTLLFSSNKISIMDRNNCYQNGLVASQQLQDVQFAGSNRILAISKDCIYEWDLRTWRLVNRFMKYNAFTKLWAKGDTVAIGNKLGVVSLSTLSGQNLKEYAEVASLVTHVTDLKGSRSGDLLVECSKWKKNAVRLIDVNQGRIISGWPAVNTKIGLPTVSTFSPSSHMCFGNSHGYLSFYSIQQQ